MPFLSRLFIKTAFLYLLAGAAVGAMLLIQKAIPGWGGIWQYLPLHIQWMVFGWMLQLVMGVAYWMLPRFGAERRREGAAAAAYFLMNLGILLLAAAQIEGNTKLTILGSLTEMSAVLCFMIHAWPRIKPFSES
jgi:cbb3-type cytochrome oxidase subunit 1